MNVDWSVAGINILLFRLESQCVISVCFVKNEEELLDSPIWVLLINIVALEMLKAKLPPSKNHFTGFTQKNRKTGCSSETLC